jgi:hypothetical protein
VCVSLKVLKPKLHVQLDKSHNVWKNFKKGHCEDIGLRAEFGDDAMW